MSSAKLIHARPTRAVWLFLSSHMRIHWSHLLMKRCNFTCNESTLKLGSQLRYDYDTTYLYTIGHKSRVIPVGTFGRQVVSTGSLAQARSQGVRWVRRHPAMPKRSALLSTWLPARERLSPPRVDHWLKHWFIIDNVQCLYMAVNVHSSFNHNKAY